MFLGSIIFSFKTFYLQIYSHKTRIENVLWNRESKIIYNSFLLTLVLACFYNVNAMFFPPISQYINGGTLEKLLADKEEELPWTIRIKLSLDIARGLQYLHSCRLIHRDLTSSVSLLVFYILSSVVLNNLEMITHGLLMDKWLHLLSFNSLTHLY